MHYTDCAHVRGRAEPHHGKTRDGIIKGALHSRALAYLSDVDTRGAMTVTQPMLV